MQVRSVPPLKILQWLPTSFRVNVPIWASTAYSKLSGFLLHKCHLHSVYRGPSLLVAPETCQEHACLRAFVPALSAWKSFFLCLLIVHYLTSFGTLKQWNFSVRSSLPTLFKLQCHPHTWHPVSLKQFFFVKRNNLKPKNWEICWMTICRLYEVPRLKIWSVDAYTILHIIFYYICWESIDFFIKIIEHRYGYVHQVLALILVTIYWKIIKANLVSSVLKAPLYWTPRLISIIFLSISDISI